MSPFFFNSPYLKPSSRPLFKKIIIWFFAIIFLLICSGVLVAAGVVIYYSRGLPSPEEMKNINFTQSTVIMDREENPLYTIHGEENREVVPLSEISKHVISATVAIEDHDFYSHYGFYPKRIIAAAISNFFNRGIVQGGSTITQQFVKNTFLSSEKTYARKIKELILAVRLENNFTKEEILEMYLNKIPYGNNAYGIQRAAQIYFSKKAKDLSLAESAVLAALPQAPSYYNPYGQHRYSAVTTEFDVDSLQKRKIIGEADLNLNEISRGLLGQMNKLEDKQSVYIRGRTDIVLREMYNMRLITAEEKKTAWEETQKITFEPYRELITAPHFVLYIKEKLEGKYGKDTVEKGGLKVVTTLDPKLQTLAEQAIKDKAEFNLANFNVNNSALLSVQPATGQILAMVGSADYYNEKIQGNVNVVTRPRQPGSSFKPFVYALTFLKRFSPANIIYDLEIKFEQGIPPKNFDGKFYGPISIRRALGQSRNIPAIKAYFLAGEQKAIIPFVKKLGIENLDPNFDYGWPLALGSGELTMMEMVQGYSVFANTGIKVGLNPFLKITDSKGKILEQWTENDKKEQVMDPQVAFLINNILSDPTINFGAKQNIGGYRVATKTGTSTKKIKSDIIVPANGWIFGYTPQLLTSVWIGNTDGSALGSLADGYNTAAPIWNTFMAEALKEQTAVDFPVPSGIQKMTVSKASGKLSSSLTPEDQLITDYFASFSVPTEIDTSFQEATIDTLSNKLATTYCPEDLKKTRIFRIYHDIDPRFEEWGHSLQYWLKSAENITPSLPTEKCDLHTALTGSAVPTIQIVSPSPFSNIETGFTKVQIKVDAPHGVDRVEYMFDGRVQYTAKTSPYNGQIRLNKAAKRGTQHVIGVKIYDTLKYSSSTEITVTLPEKTENKPAENPNSDSITPSTSDPGNTTSPPTEPLDLKVEEP